MRRRQPFPTVWLMTDERADAGLEAALARLPRGGGVIFRHHRTPPAARRARYEQVRAVARRRGLVLVLAGSPMEAIGWRADGAHGRSPHRRAARPLLRTAPAHDQAELVRARRAGAMALVSPIFPTRSHPGGRLLGVVRFGMMARADGVPVIALGGMTARRFARLSGLGADGWAAIDAWADA